MRNSAIVLLVTVVSCAAAAPKAAQRDSQGAAGAMPAPQAPSTQEINDRFQRQIAEEIAGKADKPAGDVFQNVQIEWLKSVPASNLLDIMNFGYSKALGVTCSHCHDTDAFANDDKRPKRAAREMAVMHHSINDQLRNMRNLEIPPADRLINCSTCHRGKVNPRQAAK
jgi:hypothetical protein